MDNKNQSSTNIRYYNLDLFKFIFVVLVCYYHFIQGIWIQSYSTHYPILQEMLNNRAYLGNIANFFMFVVAGFFLGKQILNQNYNSRFFYFSLHRLIRFYPTLLFLFCCQVLMHTFGIESFNFEANILNLFLINKTATGLVNSFCDCNSTWFVIALFWCSLLFMGLFLYVEKNLVKFYFLVSLITFCFFSLYMHTNVSFDEVTENFIVTRAFCLALSSIGLGLIVEKLSNTLYIEHLSLNTNYILITIFTFFECLILFILVKVALLDSTIFTNLSMICFIPLALFVLCILKYGIVTKFLNCPFFSKLGRYGFSIYMMQDLAFPIIARVWQNDFIKEKIGGGWRRFLDLHALDS